MQKIVIDPKSIDSSLIKRCVETLLEGGIVAIPTETVYGLAGCAHNDTAIEKLYKIKKRPKNKPFTYALASQAKAKKQYFSTLPPFGYRLMEKFWPGPLTVIYYSPKEQEKKVGVRIPAHPVVREILSELNEAIIFSSANISGKKDLLTAKEVESAFGSTIDLIIDSPLGGSDKPSTVLDLTYYPFKVVREGDVSKRNIVEVFIRKRILFVCTGNTCRSPMAQFLFQKYLEKAKPYLKNRYEIISRGIKAFEGSGASDYVINMLKEKEGIDVAGFSSKNLTRDDVLSSDLIFVMEKVQRSYILNLEPTAAGRIFHLGQFFSPGIEEDIPDPIGKGIEVYEEVFDLIRKAVDELKGWM